MSVYVAPADSRLMEAVANEGWLDDERFNQDMGYGSGEVGAKRAYQDLVGAFQGQALFGVYRDGDPVAFAILQEMPSNVTHFYGVVAPQYRGTILTKRVLEAIERATLGNGTYRLETEILLRNDRAMRLLKALGFKPEGVHKARHLMDGKREKTTTLRLLKTEWRQ